MIPIACVSFAICTLVCLMSMTLVAGENYG